MPVWLFILLVLPMAIDGFTQLFGLRESTPGLRFITGALMGAATVWFAYPYVEEAMSDVVRQSKPPSRSGSTSRAGSESARCRFWTNRRRLALYLALVTGTA